ncbi:glutaredoxin [Vairimorpha apis BRL 01]|uniref:Glutaredoxin n=1 Tax=Vairimorpha apis BRL 01 TaxID=1037528 RepID=T0MF06_9MICR|nr:glutaredoxin [Vairimorpha apis BRL 01]
MDYNKNNNPFYEIDYCNKVIFFDAQFDDSLITEDYLKIKLTNDSLKTTIFERYGLKKLPCLLYYKKVIDLTKEQIEKIEQNKTLFLKSEFENIHIKKFNRWPTFPQFFVRGEFIGGCDIIVELDKKGEFDNILKT